MSSVWWAALAGVTAVQVDGLLHASDLPTGWTECGEYAGHALPDLRSLDAVTAYLAQQPGREAVNCLTCLWVYWELGAQRRLAWR
jgi:hypothetical protein